MVETELERLMVRLVGDSGDYSGVLESAIRDAGDFTAQIETKMREAAQQSKMLEDTAGRMGAVSTTALAEYAESLVAVETAFEDGLITALEYAQGNEKLDASLQKVVEAEIAASKAIEQENQELARAKQITDSVVSAEEAYGQTISELRSLLDGGRISQETYNRALERSLGTLPEVQAAQQAENAAVQRAQQIVDSAKTAQDQYRQKIEDLSIALDKGKIDQDEFNKAVDRLSFDKSMAGLNQIAQGMTSIGVRMTAVGAAISAPLILLGNQAVNASSNLGESINAVNVTFGEASDIVMQYAADADQAMGLSQRAFNEAATTTGSLLQNLAGLSATDSANEFNKLAQRASDMASVFNTDVSDAMAAVSSALRGETEPIRRYGVSLDQVSIKAKALEMGIAGAGQELTREQKTLAALQIVYDQTERTAGDFANTSGELANASRVQQAAYENLMATIGDDLIPIKMKLLQVTTSVMGIFASLSPETQSLVTLFGVLTAGVGITIGVLGASLVVVGQMITAYTAIATVLKESTAAQWLFNAAVVANPYVAIAAAIVTATALVGYGLYQLQRHFGVFDPIIEAAQKLCDEVKEELAPVIDLVSEQFRSMSGDLASELVPIIEEVASVLRGLMEIASPLIPLFGEELKNAVRGFGVMMQIILPMIQNAAEGFKVLMQATSFIMQFSTFGGISMQAEIDTSELEEAQKVIDKTSSSGKEAVGQVNEDSQKLVVGLQQQLELIGKNKEEMEQLKLAAKLDEAKASPEDRQKAVELLDQIQAAEATESIKDLTKGFDEQREAIGKNKEEMEQLKLAMQLDEIGATSEERGKAIESLDKLQAAQAEQELADAVKTTNDGLMDQFMQLAKGADEYKLWKLQMDGFSETQLEVVRGGMELVKWQEEQNKAIERGKAMMEQYRTPIEKIQKQMEDLANLKDIGAINESTFNRAMAGVEKELEGIQDKAEIDLRFNYEGLGAGTFEDIAQIEEQIARIRNREVNPDVQDDANVAGRMLDDIRDKREAVTGASEDQGFADFVPSDLGLGLPSAETPFTPLEIASSDVRDINTKEVEEAPKQTDLLKQLVRNTDPKNNAIQLQGANL